MKKNLINTNSNLKDPTVRARSLALNVASSAAIEGILVQRDVATGRFVAAKSSGASVTALKESSLKRRKKAAS